MWKRKLLSLCCTLLVALPALAAPIRSDKVWSGSITLKEMVTVEPGATLTIAPGTTLRATTAEAGLLVYGTIKINGTAARPVLLSGVKGWKGIILSETGAAPHRFDYARFADA
jgi:hypothetical protein